RSAWAGLVVGAPPEERPVLFKESFASRSKNEFVKRMLRGLARAHPVTRRASGPADNRSAVPGKGQLPLNGRDAQITSYSEHITNPGCLGRLISGPLLR